MSLDQNKIVDICERASKDSRIRCDLLMCPILNEVYVTSGYGDDPYDILSGEIIVYDDIDIVINQLDMDEKRRLIIEVDTLTLILEDYILETDTQLTDSLKSRQIALLESITKTYTCLEDSLIYGKFSTNPNVKLHYTISELLTLSDKEFNEIEQKHTAKLTALSKLRLENYKSNELSAFNKLNQIIEKTIPGTMLLYNVKVQRLIKPCNPIS